MIGWWGYGAGVSVTTAALGIVRGPGDTVTFVRQQRGPYAGSLLLPGGKIEFGEAAEEAARREVAEESGCEVRILTPVGVYEIRGTGPDGAGYHFVMFTFLAEGEQTLRVGHGGHHVDGILQARVEDVRPHPTVRRILNDAGVGRYDPDDLAAALTADGITMTCHVMGSPARATG
ncbi:MAG: 8-oxo-dGTP diphosphatase [Actinomycetota bacterium]|nr:8-oxo-dGTP diphosphatase [Actinomycetota bacterium]